MLVLCVFNVCWFFVFLMRVGCLCLSVGVNRSRFLKFTSPAFFLTCLLSHSQDSLARLMAHGMCYYYGLHSQSKYLRFEIHLL